MEEDSLSNQNDNGRNHLKSPITYDFACEPLKTTWSLLLPLLVPLFILLLFLLQLSGLVKAFMETRFESLLKLGGVLSLEGP